MIDFSTDDGRAITSKSVLSIDIIGNDIECDDSIGVDEDAIRELIERGYNKTEIFGLTHMFVARKRARPQLRV